MMAGQNKTSDETAKRIPKHTIGAEIGVWKGDTSAKFLAAHPKELHLVDPWSFDIWYNSMSADKQVEVLEKYSIKLGIHKTPESFQKYYDKIYASVKMRFKNNNNVTIHRMGSKQWFETTSVELDWIYIDGNHSYDGCLFDLNASLKVLKPNGIIFGDDYGNKEGVKHAVDDFILQHNFQLDLYSQNQFQINT